MTPKQLGHRAAAWGDHRIAPAIPLPEANAWIAAFDAVEAHRAKGLDPAGHQPRIPHLCTRDVSKVCNCCETCCTACWAEKFDGVSASGLVKSMLRNVLSRWNAHEKKAAKK